MNRLLNILIVATALVSTSCLDNDIPYPVVDLKILAIEGEGFTLNPNAIDLKTRTATLLLDEQTDISRVKITKVSITDKATPSQEMVGTFDMRAPLYVTLSLYQDYEWTILAQQTIERKFSVEGQIGDTEFDLLNHTALVKVSMDADLNDIKVNELKLGPANITTMTPSKDELTSFDGVRQVTISYHNFTEQWKLFVIKTDVAVAIKQVDAWAKILWLKGQGKSSTTLGFRYRKSGDTEWISVPQNDITVDNGTFSAKVSGVNPNTKYEVVATSGNDISAVTTVTTDYATELPNSSFELWSQGSNKAWYPYTSLDQAFWGTGNPGALTLGDEKYNLTTASTDVPAGATGVSAQLQSKWVVAKFAAGNMFVGTYAETIGTNGKVNFGRPYKSRPVALHGYVKYNCGKITDVKSSPADHPLKVGDDDNGMIYIAVGNWDAATYGGTESSPVQVFTKDQTTFFKPHGPNVIGYGEKVFSTSVTEWTEFTIKLDYTATNIIPTHLIIVCSASRWGDYFSGSTDSVMWIDNFELIYE